MAAKSLCLNEKTTVIAFRGVIFALLCFLLLYNPSMEATFSSRPFLLVGLYLLSNLILVPVDASRFKGSLLSVAVFLFDTAWISGIIYASEGVGSDLYLIYFLVVFMSGIQMKIWQSFLVGSVASLLYIGLWIHARPGEDILTAHILLRLPFFYLVSFFTAYFAHQVQEREHDVRDRYELELVKAERRAIAGRLAGNIAFKMTNPLSVVIGFAQSLLKHADRSSTQYNALRHILDGANRCRDMIESLMLLSDQTWASMDAVAINPLIRDTVAGMKESGAFESGVELRVELGENLPRVRAERRQLSRAVRELIKNAAEAMPQGGVVTLKTRWTRKTGGDEVECRIEDTGGGVAPSCWEQIFEPFFTTKEGDGKGMGLSYVSAIAQRHRGAVRFEPRPGGGASFTMTLPACEEAG